MMRFAAARTHADSFWRWSFTILALVLWAVAAANLPPYLFPGPLPVLEALAALLVDPVQRTHVVASVGHVAAAIALAFATGFLLAGLAHALPLFRPLIQYRLTPFLNAFSGIGWALIAIIWFGIDTITVIFVITVVLLPFNIINIGQGLDGLDADFMEMGRSFSTSAWRRFRMIVLPLLAPLLFASLRLSFGVSWKIALTAELLGGDKGLGYLMNIAMQEQFTARILGIALFIVLFVYVAETFVLDRLQQRIERRYVPA